MALLGYRLRGVGWTAVAAAGVLAFVVAGTLVTSRPADATQLAVGVGDGSGGNVFVPATVNVGAGSTVTWNWASGFHSVVAVDGSFDSGSHGTPGAPFSRTFSSAGTVFYYCSVHATAADATDAGIAAGEMVGKVVVAQSQGAATATGTATRAATAAATGTPGVPKTGQAGLGESSSSVGAALLLFGLAGVTVLGARMLTSRSR
jgi:plastocyanin